MTTYSSQVPPVVAEYFADRFIGRQVGHPVVSQIYRERKGWTRMPNRKYVSHSYLVQLQADGVTAVALLAGGREADFWLAELIGPMGTVDAEVQDAVPELEGASATRDLSGIARLLIRGLSVDQLAADAILAEVDRCGHTEFTVEKRGYSPVDPRGSFEEGWRYRLVRKSGQYTLTVLVHETKD